MINACTCGHEMKSKKNGVRVLKLDSKGNGDGVWAADLWKCPGCEHETLTGFGFEPLYRNYDPGFSDAAKTVDYTVR